MVANEALRPWLPSTGPCWGSLKSLLEDCWSHDPALRPDFDTIIYIIGSELARTDLVPGVDALAE